MRIEIQGKHGAKPVENELLADYPYSGISIPDDGRHVISICGIKDDTTEGQYNVKLHRDEVEKIITLFNMQG